MAKTASKAAKKSPAKKAAKKSPAKKSAPKANKKDSLTGLPKQAWETETGIELANDESPQL